MVIELSTSPTVMAHSFYAQAKEKFGDEAWGLLQKHAGDIG